MALAFMQKFLCSKWCQQLVFVASWAF